MLSTSEHAQFAALGRPALPENALLDEPEVRSWRHFICELTSSRELHDALRLTSEELRSFLGARFVVVAVFEDEEPETESTMADPAAIGIPLRVGGRNVGLITAYFDEPRTLASAEVRAMDVIAAVAAVTLENARRLQRERKRLTQAEMVNVLAPRIAVARSADELARLVVAALKEQLHYDAARFLWGNGDDELTCLAASGGRGNEYHIAKPWSDGDVALRVCREGKPLLIGDHGGWLGGGSAIQGLRSLLAVPLQGNDRVLGVLEVGARSPRAFDNVDLATLASLAALVAAVGEKLATAGGRMKPAKEGERGRNELLSAVVHDLRGPLSIVKGYASTLARLGDGVDREKRRRFLTRIDEAVDRMSAMVDQLSGVSRFESGQVKLQLRPIDLRQLTTETVERLRAKIGEHNVLLELPGEMVPVHVDVEQLGKALGHLLLNAAKRGASSGRIRVTITSHAAGVQERLREGFGGQRLSTPETAYGTVEVCDEGPSASREDLGKVFDRLPTIRSEGGSKKGNWLALYLVRRIVEAHGGQVWAHGERGQGNSLCFRIPMGVVEKGRETNRHGVGHE